MYTVYIIHISIHIYIYIYICIHIIRLFGYLLGHALPAPSPLWLRPSQEHCAVDLRGALTAGCFVLEAGMDHFDIQSTGQKSHCVNTF